MALAAYLTDILAYTAGVLAYIVDYSGQQSRLWLVLGPIDAAYTSRPNQLAIRWEIAAGGVDTRGRSGIIGVEELTRLEGTMKVSIASLLSSIQLTAKQLNDRLPHEETSYMGPESDADYSKLAVIWAALVEADNVLDEALDHATPANPTRPNRQG